MPTKPLNPKITRMYKKGQIFSTDAIFALITFSVVVIMSFSLINTQISKSVNIELQNQMNEKAFEIADFLVRTPGYPDNWTSSNVKLVGLASPDHVLQIAKLSQLNNISYTDLGTDLKARPYNFLINISSSGYNYSKGLVWNSSASKIVVVERSVLINTSFGLERGILRVYLW